MKNIVIDHLSGLLKVIGVEIIAALNEMGM
jgi:hypothetical protein